MTQERKIRKDISKEMAETAKRMLEQNSKTTEIARILNISRSAACHLVKNLIEHGDDHIKMIENKKLSSRITPTSHTNWIYKAIEDAIVSDNSLTQGGISKRVHLDTGI